VSLYLINVNDKASILREGQNDSAVGECLVLLTSSTSSLDTDAGIVKAVARDKDGVK